MAEVRVGKVSKVDYASGMIKVVYPDRDNAVTDLIPILSFNGEYKMPKVDQAVLVVHLSDNVTAGVVLGTYWDRDNLPKEHGKGIYRKEFDNIQGEAYQKYDANTRTLIIKADRVVFETSSGVVTLEEIISKLQEV